MQSNNYCMVLIRVAILLVAQWVIEVRMSFETIGGLPNITADGLMFRTTFLKTQWNILLAKYLKKHVKKI
jgi:hypothetical protein